MSHLSARLFSLVKIVTTVLGDQAGGVLANVRALAAGDNDADAETSPEEPLGGGAFLFRPRDEDKTGYAEAFTARTEDDLQPLGWMRDLRIAKARGHIGKGTATMAGYGKAFVSVDDAPSGGGNIITIYAPFDFDGQGVAQKAHVVQLDTTSGAESVSVVHALGQGLVLTKDGNAVLRNKDGTVYLSLEGAQMVVGGTLKAATSLVGGDIASAQSVALAPALLDWGGAPGATSGSVASLLTKIIAAVNVLAPGTISPAEIAAFAVKTAAMMSSKSDKVKASP